MQLHWRAEKTNLGIRGLSQIDIATRQNQSPDISSETTIANLAMSRTPSSSSSNSVASDTSGSSRPSGAGRGVGDSSNSGGDSTGSYTSHSSKLSKEEQEQLAAKETRMIRRSRICFVLLLMCMAATAAALTYYLSSQAEVKKFESEFQDYAQQIKDATDANAKRVHNSLEGFAVTVTSFSLDSEVQWPNLTLPHFSQRGAALVELSGVDLVMLNPVVPTSLKEGWERFAGANPQWIDCTMIDLSPAKIDIMVPPQIKSNMSIAEAFTVHSWISKATGIPLEDIKDIYQVPVWEMYPMKLKDLSKVNFDLLSHPVFHRLFHWILVSNDPVLSEIIDVPTLFGLPSDAKTSSYRPRSILIQPVFKGFSDCNCTTCKPDNTDGGVNSSQEVGALAVAVLPWDTYLTKVLPQNVDGVYVVLRNTCGDVFTYQIDGHNALFLGSGDHHDAAYDNMKVTTLFDPFDGHTAGYHETNATNGTSANCFYFFDIYPSHEMETVFLTNKPIMLTFAVVVIFVFTTLAFAVYDCLVQKRQEMVMDSAMRSNAIVSSLFPAKVRDRLFSSSKNRKNKLKKELLKKGGLLPALTEAPKFRLNSFLAEKGKDDDSVGMEDSNVLHGYDKPIADLFPSATVLFADIVNFTAWSSMRDPAAVFTLLETVYRAFDRIARRRKVFKVETIGDCYLAVSGLPEPRHDHAIVMARFARECLSKMNALTAKLEEALGPDTGDLTLRIGLNSGPVTAGVLRGEKSRFQLFGDTVNTAARMESTGVSNKIQISNSTAQLLKEAGKDHWFVPREDKVLAKGKGVLETFWLRSKEATSPRTRTSSEARSRTDEVSSHAGSDSTDKALEQGKCNAKSQRMVGWIVEVLAGLLRQIVAKRKASGEVAIEPEDSIQKLEDAIGRGNVTVQEEVTDFVALPEFNKELAESMEDFTKIELKPDVLEQLRLYVTEIANMYRENPFHSFEHASHVTMSISKLLGRIVAADVAPGEKDYGQGHILARLHTRTYGITSDPLTQFTTVFSGLIHDVDHRGIPNFVLVKEDAELASMYKCKSVAEQNSVDLAWERLMEPEFKDLRRCIYSTTKELVRFRQTLVNIIMATDIFDKDFSDLRKRRWEMCFHPQSEAGLSSDCYFAKGEDGNNVFRKATIVLEHLIQASDVAHTMQHWQIYRKWNGRLFSEMYRAYKAGRLEKDPSENWYQSELGFFDNYVIPLAKKLRECGVFGVSSDEYLNYALSNRTEWEAKGRSIVEDMMKTIQHVGLWRPESSEETDCGCPDVTVASTTAV